MKLLSRIILSSIPFLILFVFVHSVSAQWSTDLTPPVVVFTVTGSGCTPSGTTNPNGSPTNPTSTGCTGTVTVSYVCDDGNGRGDSNPCTTNSSTPSGQSFTSDTTITVTARDSVGNVSGPFTQTIRFTGPTVPPPTFTPTPPLTSAPSCGVTIFANGAAPTLNTNSNTPVTLSWTNSGDTDNLLQASGNWGPGDVPSNSSSFLGNLAPGTFTFTITCRGADNISRNSTVTVNVASVPTNTTPPGACGVGINANGVFPVLNTNSTTAVTLLWISQDVPSGLLTASGSWNTDQPANGVFTLSLGTLTPGVYTYTVTCRGADGISRSSTVTVNVSGPVTATPTLIPATPTITPTLVPTNTPPPLTACGFSFFRANGTPALVTDTITPVTLTWASVNDTDSLLQQSFNWGPGDVSASGSHLLGLLPAGAYFYTLTCSGPDGVSRNITARVTVNAVATSTPLPTPTSVPITITGNVFVDTDRNGIKDGAEVNYTAGPSTIQARQNSCLGTLIDSDSPANGAFSVQIPSVGTYVLCYTSLPSGYTMTAPLNGPPPSRSIAGSHDFGIINVVPWWQSPGGDARIDTGINNSIPLGATCGPYASKETLPTALMPGIIFSGDNTHSFGNGQASPNPWNWAVGGPDLIDQEVYRTASGIVPTSYNSLLTITKQNNITPSPLSGVCTTNSCTLTNPATGSQHIFQNTGDVTINSASFGGGNDYVILIDGNLRINGNITVPVGSTVTFSVSGNISVSSTVGGPYNDEATKHIQGFYSTDRNFIVEGINNCGSGADLRLNIAGSVVVNASLNGGTFINNRDLCGNNASCPAFSVSSRPDMLLNAPAFLQRSNSLWQEVAP